MIPLKDNIRLERFPLVTAALVLTNVVVYLVSIRHGGGLVSGPSDRTLLDGGAMPFALTHPGAAGAAGRLPTWLTPLSAMFMHASLLQLAGDMLFLVVFGPAIEDSMGRVRFLAFYVLGGLAALAVLVAVDPDSTAVTVGAAGAIAGVLGAYLVLYRPARIITVVLVPFFFTIVEVPALALLGAWLVMQALFAAAGLTEPLGSNGAAYLAHIGGLVFGVCSVRLFTTGRRAIPRRRALA